MEAIAKRAKVSKETLYRWWHSKTELLLDALAERGQQTIPLPDTGTLHGDLRTFLRATVDSADDTTVRLLHHLAAAAASDQTVADQVRDRFLVTRRAALGQLLHRAVARGEVKSGYAALAVDLVLRLLVVPPDLPRRAPRLHMGRPGRLRHRVTRPDDSWRQPLASADPRRPPSGHTGRREILAGRA